MDLALGTRGGRGVATYAPPLWKESGKRKKTSRDGSLFDPLGTYSLHCTQSYLALFPFTVPVLIHFASSQYALPFCFLYSNRSRFSRFFFFFARQPIDLADFVCTSTSMQPFLITLLFDNMIKL